MAFQFLIPFLAAIVGGKILRDKQKEEARIRGVRFDQAVPEEKKKDGVDV